MMELERDPTFRMHDMYDLTKDQIRERTMEKVRKLANKAGTHGLLLDSLVEIIVCHFRSFVTAECSNP